MIGVGAPAQPSPRVPQGAIRRYDEHVRGSWSAQAVGGRDIGMSTATSGLSSNDIGEVIRPNHGSRIHREELAARRRCDEQPAARFFTLELRALGRQRQALSAPTQLRCGLGTLGLLCDFVTDGSSFPPASRPMPDGERAPAGAQPRSGRAWCGSSERVAAPSPLSPEQTGSTSTSFCPTCTCRSPACPIPHQPDDGEPAELRYPPRQSAAGDASAIRTTKTSTSRPAREVVSRLSVERHLQRCGGRSRRVSRKAEPLSGRCGLRLVQVGDMYDLWIGLDRYFDVQADDAVLLSDGPDALGLKSAQRFIDYWVDRTNRSAATRAPSACCRMSLATVDTSRDWPAGKP